MSNKPDFGPPPGFNAWLRNSNSQQQLTPHPPSSRQSRIQTARPQTSMARRTTMHSPKQTIPQCPLNDLDLPPISEVDHIAEQCLCHMCTCNLHICPADKFKQLRSPVSMYSSNYKTHYHKHRKSFANLQITRSFYRANNQPMDFTTTNAMDFQPYAISMTRPISQASGFSKATVGTYQTSYAQEYPNWGPAYSYHERQYHAPYRGDMVSSARQLSTYSDQFQKPLKSEDYSQYLGNLSPGVKFFGGSDAFSRYFGKREGNMKTYSSSKGMLTPSGKFIGETTNARDFKDKLGQRLSTNQFNSKHKFDKLLTSEGHYKTTYVSDYQKKSRIHHPRKKEFKHSLR